MEKEFFDFIYERHLIWYKRFILKENPPWTNDEVLQKFKIINVYRELDKGTKYIIEKLQNNPREIIFLNVVFYRFFNRYLLYGSLELEPFEKLPKEKIIEKFKTQTTPIFNSAYIISSQKGCKYENVLNSIQEVSANIKNYIEEIDSTKTPQESFEIIKKIKLVGPFLAYEIWTDLTYFNFFKQGWTDNDFVNIGPGAKWGLEILFGKLSKKQLLEKINYLKEIQKQYLNNDEWKKISLKTSTNYPFLSLRNIEHSLCEFRKYYNIKNNIGRRKYFKQIT